uniref:Ig-like domain-containing protein n=1 Tax=Gasterosteus aculeatus aculeatus TaxID=481459 RepID=A0AAQ4RE62_GASAC
QRCVLLCMDRAHFVCVPGVSQSVLITQWPRYISSPPNGSAEMTCYQNDTNYDYLYWYQQLSGRSFQLIVSTVGGFSSFEVGFKSGFQSVKFSEKQWSLTVTGLQGNHAAVYLCAASLHSAVADLRPVTKT